MAVKTKISKAYDRLKWSFIRAVLERLGFSDTFVSRMMECVSMVSYSFLLNNEVVGNVHPLRDIRHGDPFNPISSLYAQKSSRVFAKQHMRTAHYKELGCHDIGQN